MCEDFAVHWRRLPVEIRRAIFQDYCPAHNATPAHLTRARHKIQGVRLAPQTSIAVSKLPVWTPAITGACMLCGADLETVDWVAALQFSSSCYVWACLACLSSCIYYRYHQNDDLYYRDYRCRGWPETEVTAWARLPPPWSPEILQIAAHRRILGGSVFTFQVPGRRAPPPPGGSMFP